MNGSLINHVPLKYLKQFPDHVATSFVYLHASVSGVKSPTISHNNTASNGQEFASTSVSYNSQATFHSYFNNNNTNSNQQNPISGAACSNMPYMPVNESYQVKDSVALVSVKAVSNSVHEKKSQINRSRIRSWYCGWLEIKGFISWQGAVDTC